MKVYVLEGGDYENYGWHAVYDSLEAAIADNPPPGTPGGIPMRHVADEHTDPTPHRAREGGWQKDGDGRWDNGFGGDFGCRIIETELRTASPSEEAARPRDDDMP